MVEQIPYRIPWAGRLRQVDFSKVPPSVSHRLPSGYAQYVRLFHPFVERSINSADRQPVPHGTRWAELAALAQVGFGPTLTGRQVDAMLPGENWTECPWCVWEGELEEATAAALFDLLDDGGLALFAFDLTASIHGSGQVLFQASSVAERSEVIDAARAAGPSSATTAEVVWAADERWISVTDYDLSSTYLALDHDLAERVLGDEFLETVEVALDTRVDHHADEQQT